MYVCMYVCMYVQAKNSEENWMMLVSMSVCVYIYF